MSTLPERVALAATIPLAFWLSALSAHERTPFAAYTTKPASPISSADATAIAEGIKQEEAEPERPERFLLSDERCSKLFCGAFVAYGAVTAAFYLGVYLATGETDSYLWFLDVGTAVMLAVAPAIGPYVYGDALGLVKSSLGQGQWIQTVVREARSVVGVRLVAVLGACVPLAYAWAPAAAGPWLVVPFAYFHIALVAPRTMGAKVPLKLAFAVPLVVLAVALVLFGALALVLRLTLGPPEDGDDSPEKEESPSVALVLLFLSQGLLTMGFLSWLVALLYRLDRILDDGANAAANEPAYKPFSLGDVERAVQIRSATTCDEAEPVILLPPLVLGQPTGVRVRLPTLPGMVRARCGKVDTHVFALSYARVATAAFVVVDLCLPTVLQAISGKTSAALSAETAARSHLFAVGLAPPFILLAVGALALARGQTQLVLDFCDDP